MSLDTFELHWNNTTSTFKAAERWMPHIVNCEPRVIVVYLSGTPNETDQPLDFINYIFEIGSLEKLNLQAHFYSEKDYFVKPKSISLNHLKKLNISGLMSLDDDFMDRLMRGSPVLEKLFLSCYCAKLSSISSQSLKYLEIYYMDDNVMNISAPNLVYLSIDAAIPGKFSCNNLVSLVEAYIDINYCSYDGKAAFLSSFSNAKILHFPNIATDMFEEESPHCQTFNNLRELDCQVTSFYPIADFLQHAPNLEQLTLRYYDGCDDMSEDYEDRDFSICCNKLKTIEIYHVHSEEAHDALNLLSYMDELPDNVDIRLRRA